MKTFILSFVLAVALTPGVSWATEVHNCIGKRGEASFKDSPCAGQTAVTKKYSPDSALERVELEIVKLKREMMDLERLYNKERSGANVKDAPELTRRYALDSIELRDQLRRQELLKMQLVEKSVGSYLTAEVEN